MNNKALKTSRTEIVNLDNEQTDEGDVLRTLEHVPSVYSQRSTLEHVVIGRCYRTRLVAEVDSSAPPTVAIE